MVSPALDKKSNSTYRFSSLSSLPKKTSGTEALAFEENSLWEQTNYLTKWKVMLHNRGYRKRENTFLVGNYTILYSIPRVSNFLITFFNYNQILLTGTQASSAY